MIVLTVVLVVVACLWLLDRQQRRHDQERRRWQALTDRLAERVQHPEIPQPELGAEPSDRPLYVSPFDDDGFNELKAA
jgi:hypothetical protein